MKKISIIITAGGIGKRMESDIPKQFLLLNSKPVLLHTLEKFNTTIPEAEIVITLPLDWKSYWENILKKFNCTIPHTIIDGGKERYHSVKSALDVVKGENILIHDGVRPLLSETLIERCVSELENSSAFVPVLKIKESLRKVNEENTTAINRSNYLVVQTPQCFSSEVIKQAYRQPFDGKSFDDATLVEKNGVNITTIKGDDNNIKITTPKDIILAEMLMNNNF